MKVKLPRLGVGYARERRRKETRFRLKGDMKCVISDEREAKDGG